MGLLLATLSVRFVDELAWFLPAGTLESFRHDLRLTYAQAAAVLAVAAPGALAGLVFTAATDRHSRRAIATAGALGFTASLLLVAISQSCSALLLASFLMALASTAMVDAVEVALVDLVPPPSLRRWLAAQNLLAAVGDLAGPALLAAVFWAGGSWRTAFWIAAFVMAAYTLLLAASPLPPPAAYDDVEESAPWRDVVLAVARDRRVWVLGALSTLAGPFDEDFFAFLIAALQRTRGVGAALAVIVASASVLGGFVILAAVVRRVNRWSDRTLFLRGACALALGTLLVGVGIHLVVAAAGAFLVGAGLNLCWVAVQHQTLVARPGQAGVTKAGVSAIEFSGVALTLGLGSIADAWGVGAVFVLYVVMAIALIALAWLTLPDRIHEP